MIIKNSNSNTTIFKKYSLCTIHFIRHLIAKVTNIYHVTPAPTSVLFVWESVDNFGWPLNIEPSQPTLVINLDQTTLECRVSHASNS